MYMYIYIYIEREGDVYYISLTPRLASRPTRRSALRQFREPPLGHVGFNSH